MLNWNEKSYFSQNCLNENIPNEKENRGHILLSVFYARISESKVRKTPSFPLKPHSEDSISILFVNSV